MSRPPESFTLDSRALSTVRRKLLQWFDSEKRSLPWRTNRDSYRIWVSEVMLQQTTVAAVVPYFDRFVAAFPTLTALAAADEQEVLRLWQGLGYYRRARHLLAAAKQLYAEHGKTPPDDPEVWSKLPGVGRYILGAVLSQAFDRRLPIVEANSLRVLSRLFASRLDPREGDGKKWVWAAAERVLPRKRVGDFNQALMELGALVCSPIRPACDRCPIRNECLAYGLGIQSLIPPPPQRKQTVTVREVALVLRNRGRVLLCQNPPTADRWANMWELPRGSVGEAEDWESAARRVAGERLGISIDVGGEAGVVCHGVTRFAITLVAMEATRVNGNIRTQHYTASEWVNTTDHYPMGTPHRKLFEAVINPNRQRPLC